MSANEIGTVFPSLSAHVLVRLGDDCRGVRRKLERMLDGRSGIDHKTPQVDHEPERVVQSGEPRRRYEPHKTFPTSAGWPARGLPRT